MKKKESEFGKGFVYNLILFAHHFDNENARRIRYSVEKKDSIEATNQAIIMWANGATDHLFGLEIPPDLVKTKLGKLAISMREKGLEIGHGFNHRKTYTLDDYENLWKQVKEITFLIDEKLGLKPIKGSWE